MRAMFMHKEGDIVILRLTGEITMARVPIPREEVDAVFALMPFVLVRADLSATTFMDSTGVNFLAMLNNRLREAGCRLEILDVSDNARRVLDLTQLSPMLNFVFSTLPEDSGGDGE